MEPDVLVVGAGPAGAAVSILLARQGYRVVLLERETFPRDKACAEYLSPACSPLLKHLGVLEAVLHASPQRLQGMRITNHRGRSCWGRFLQEGQFLYGLALPRLVLDHLLVQQADQVGVEVCMGFWARQPIVRGKRIIGIRGQQGKRHVTRKAKLIIAADGLHSTLGRRLGVVRQVRWLRHVALVTHYTGVEALTPWGEMFLLPGGYIGLAPIGPDLVNVSLVTKATHRRAVAGQPTLWLEQAIQSHTELRQRFTQARRAKPLLVTGPMAQRTECPAHDGILFVGDAAGFFDPFTGQGIYLALHGAVLAATAAQQALETGDVSAQRLQGYYRAHRLAFDDKYRFSQCIQLGLRVPWLANHVIERFAQRPRLGDTVVSVAGDVLSPKTVLSWHFALRMLV